MSSKSLKDQLGEWSGSHEVSPTTEVHKQRAREYERATKELKQEQLLADLQDPGADIIQLLHRHDVMGVFGRSGYKDRVRVLAQIFHLDDKLFKIYMGIHLREYEKENARKASHGRGQPAEVRRVRKRKRG